MVYRIERRAHCCQIVWVVMTRVVVAWVMMAWVVMTWVVMIWVVMGQ